MTRILREFKSVTADLRFSIRLPIFEPSERNILGDDDIMDEMDCKNF